MRPFLKRHMTDIYLWYRSHEHRLMHYDVSATIVPYVYLKGLSRYRHIPLGPNMSYVHKTKFEKQLFIERDNLVYKIISGLSINEIEVIDLVDAYHQEDVKPTLEQWESEW